MRLRGLLWETLDEESIHMCVLNVCKDRHMLVMTLVRERSGV